MGKRHKECCSTESGPSRKKNKVIESSSNPSISRKKSKGRLMSNVLNEGTSNVNPRSDFTSHCRPKPLLELIKILNEKQKADVRSIGFGGILDLQLTKCSNHDMLKWLINQFNSKSRVLYLDSQRFFAIMADDVCDVLMLPRNDGSPVLKYTRSEDGSDVVKHLKSTYMVDTDMNLFDTLSTKFVDGGVDFKRLFVMSCLQSFLTPTSNHKVTFSVVKSLENVDRISKLDWCSYVLDSLCVSVDYFKSRRLKNVGGCIILLQIIYFHRLKWRGVSAPCTLPLIQHWNDKTIYLRCREEYGAGFYGSGELSAIFPLTVNGKCRSSSNTENSDAEGGDVGVSNDAEGGDIGAGSDDREQDLKDLLASMVKDVTEFSKKYFPKVTELIKDSLASKEKMVRKSCSTPDAYDCIFMDERLHKYADDLYNNLIASQKLTDAILNCDLLTPEPPVRYEANYDIGEGADFGVNVSGDEEVEEERTVEDNEELNSAIQSISSKEKKVGIDSTSKFWNIREDVGYLSKYMINHKKLLSKLSQTHKEILDYCFFDAEKESSADRFYRRGVYLYIERNELLSMLPNRQIDAQVINAWCNEINHFSYADGYRSRFIFSLDHNHALSSYMSPNKGDPEVIASTWQTAWDEWLQNTKNSLCSSDMIFVPFCLHNHYAVVVVDFKDTKIWYLDNRKHCDQAEKAVFHDTTDLLCNTLSVYLDNKGHPKCKDLLHYEIVNVPFRWQTSRVDCDSGVYMIHHMMHFDGEVYTSPNLNKVDVRNLLRAEILASIVLSNQNEIRTIVIDKAYMFFKEKPSLLKLRAAKKKERQEKLHEQKKKEAGENLTKMSEIRRGKRKAGDVLPNP